ncbi:helix-turn-helix transcriptional regulator [Actinokineospora auranticolor]|uniref:Transcriptional regulator with XRE-family HTH domain n=1 Tax=Actinokineospora auranticolor TaxID=155976 RepID=A0A2S6GLV2_9PSEU|nr:helix-turn-helix transcriptional regulator [Actinokineospora auranticolor]PPK66214.1 transcriptional regulator with XRE-family HTH domain [Actinokineospora auranticolor]
MSPGDDSTGDDDRAVIAGLLRRVRARRGLSRAEVAARVPGVSEAMVRDYESRHRVPRPARLLRMLDAVGACPRSALPRPGDIVVSTRRLLEDPATPAHLAAWARLRSATGHVVVRVPGTAATRVTLDVLVGPEARAALTATDGGVSGPDQVRPRGGGAVREDPTS